MRNSGIEFAIGLVALSIIEAQQADAAVSPGIAPDHNDLSAAGFHDALGRLADVDPSALKTLTVEELKALLTVDALASLGLDKGFAALLDVDPHAALRKLEAAFRKKLAAAAHSHSEIASADGHVAGRAGEHLRDGEQLHHDSGLFGGIPLIWPILGAVAIGGIALAASSGGGSGGSNQNDAPVANADSVTTNEDTAVTFDVRTNDSDKNGDALAVTQINGTAITTTTPVTITGGTVSLGADGRLTFTPTLNYNGAPSFTYTVSDGHGGTATATVNLTVAAVNDAPVAVNDSFTVAEDTAVTINVRANDSDVDGDTLTVTQVNGRDVSVTTAVAVTGGSVILNTAGNLIFTPTANYNGSPSFTYTVSDGRGGTATATVNGTVTPVNDAPVAVNDSFTIAEDNAITINVLANDSDVDGDTLRVTQINGTAVSATVAVAVTGGSVILNAAGNLVFTPTRDYNGSPSFTYTVSDGNGGTATGTVNGTVTPVNDAPVAVNDTFTVAEDNAIVINVRANDSDVDGDTLTVTRVNGAAVSTTVAVAVTGGSVILNTAGNLVFTPTANYNGSPSFTYTVSDGNGGTATATVNGTVTPVNDAPVAVNDTFTVAEDNSIIVNVRANDSDVDGDTLAVTQVNGRAISTTVAVAVTGGSVILNTAGNLVFTPTANYNGAPSFTYTVSDGNGGTATGTVTGTVTPVNDAPVAVNDSFTVAEDNAIVVNVLANDSDVDGDTLRVTQVNGAAVSTTSAVAVTGGTVTLNTAGNLVFTPTRDYNGSPSFTYTVSDGNGGTATAVVSGTVTPVNDAPVNGLTILTLTATAGVAVTVPGLSVSDVDSANLTTTINVTQGLLTLGTVTNGATVTGAGTTTLTLAGTPAQVNASLAALTFTGTPGFSGNDTLTIRTSDGQLTDTDTLALRIGTVLTGVVQDGYISGASVFFDANGNGVYDAGEVIATSDATGHYALTVSGPLVGNIVAFGGTNIDTGLANQTVLMAPVGSSVINPLTTLVSQLVSSGLTVAQATTQLVATLGLSTGLDLTHFDFLAPSSAGDIALAVQKVALQIVTLVNQGIAAGSSSAAVTASLSQMFSTGAAVDLTSAATLTSVLTGAGLSTAAASVAATNTASINQQISDATSASAVVNTVIKLNADNVNLPPATADDTATMSEDRAIRINVLANDKDPEGGALKIIKINGTNISVDVPLAVTGGAVTLGADGQLTFTPTANYNGAPSFTYTVQDNGGNTQDAVVHLTVTPVNDAPVAVADAVATGLGAAVSINVLANDRDVDGDALSVTTVNGAAITIGHPVGIDTGNVALSTTGQLVFTPNAGFVGNTSFAYGISDGHGGTATSTVDVAVAPTSATYGFAAADFNAVFANAAALHAAGVTTFDISGTGDLGITQAQADGMVSAGLTFAAEDHVTVASTGTHLSTTLKGLQDLHVDTVMIAGGALSVVAGEGFGDLASAALPHFAGVDGVDPSVTLDLQSGNFGTTDIAAFATNLASAGVDHLDVVGGGAVSLGLAQAQALAAAHVDFTAASNVTLNVTSGQAAALDPSLLTQLHVDHVDVATNAVMLSDTTANALVAAGVDFVTSDNVTVAASGTHLSTTLKGLQDLHVDTVMIAGGVLSVAAGEAFADLASGSLPHFVNATGGDADVTLALQSGTIAPALDVSTIASNLAAAGVDHLAVAGGGAVALTLAQGQLLAAAHVDFTPASDVTLNVNGVQAAQLASNAALATQLHVDHLHVTDGAVTISDVQAANMVAAGLDFAANDAVTVQASGTHLSTTLKGLQDLHVDTVMIAGGVTALTVAAGTTDLAALAAHDLPHFAPSLDVTVNIAAGTLASGFDFGSVGAALEQAGVDHIGVGGSGALALTVAQAESFAMSGLDFAPAASVTINATPFEVAALANNPFTLTGLNIDAIHASAPVTISDVQATNLVEAGLHFAAADVVTVAAAGTHLSTTLKGLQDLHVDSIAVQAGVTALHIDAGDLHGVTAADLPSLLLAQTDAALDVTLRVDASEASDVVRLAAALDAAGIDHIAFNKPLAGFSAADQAALTSAASSNHLTITYEPFSTADALGTTSAAAIAADSAMDHAVLYRDLLTSFETSADTHGHGGSMQLVDGAASSLAEAGMLRAYTAETLVVDGTTSGDKLLTTLKDIADIGVDQVKLAGQASAPVYVDLGVANSATAVSDIQSLFRTLDLEGHATGSIFTGNDKVALVVDASTANALSHVDGALSHLATLGFTEVDVLATPGVGAPAFANPAIEVKLIGQDDPLYNHLHHAGS